MARAQLHLGPPLCCCSPSLPHALVPQLPSQHLNLWASSTLCLLTHVLLGFRSLWPSFTSGTHLFVPQFPAVLGPHVSGFLCLRVPSAQGLLAARPLLSPHSPSLVLPSSGPARSSSISGGALPVRLPDTFLGGPSFHCGEGPPCPRELMQIWLLPGGGSGSTSLRDGRHATPAWPRGPAGPADTVAAERGWLWGART